MSTLGFEVHVDKENATYVPSINKGGPMRTFGLKDAKGKVQATPRKALIDVKQINVSASRNLDRNKLDSCSTGLKDGCSSTAKPSLISNGAENIPHGLSGKQQDLVKPASVQRKGLKILKNTEQQIHKAKSTTKSKKPKPVSKCEPDIADEEYDSDSVFPSSERLSNYVDKLMSWRLPCLFGSVTQSDSESEFDELLNEEIVLDIPDLMPEVPEVSDVDLDTLMDILPPPEPDFEDN